MLCALSVWQTEKQKSMLKAIVGGGGCSEPWVLRVQADQGQEGHPKKG